MYKAKMYSYVGEHQLCENRNVTSARLLQTRCPVNQDFSNITSYIACLTYEKHLR